MIIEIVNDMKNFLIVLFIAIFGFTCGYMIISQGDPERFAGDNLFTAFIYTYRLTLGDFGLDDNDKLETRSE
jgi:ABC-type antimicrobial peptide transport system permease subunit